MDQDIHYSRFSAKACPKCGGRLLRVWRRPVDRIISLVLPVQRYRCGYFVCQWSGNLRAVPAGLATTDAQVNRPESPRTRRGGWNLLAWTAAALAVSGPLLLTGFSADDNVSVASSSRVFAIPPPAPVFAHELPGPGPDTRPSANGSQTERRPGANPASIHAP